MHILAFILIFVVGSIIAACDIFFVAETKGTMESLQLRPIEKAKIMCARRLFNEISTDNVVYHDVDSYQSLLNIMNDPSLDKKVCE